MYNGKLRPHCLPITFVPCALRRPPKDGQYLCLSHTGHLFTLPYTKSVDLFNVLVEPDGKIDTSTAIYPIAWADQRDVETIATKWEGLAW